MKMFSLSQLSEILNTKPLCTSKFDINTSVLGITTDTRTIAPGEIFIALSGENFDGHNFVDTAVDRGAIAVIVSRQLNVDLTQFVVKDTLEAYQQIARWWRDRLDIPVIGITGSVGKTSTKY